MKGIPLPCVWFALARMSASNSFKPHRFRGAVQFRRQVLPMNVLARFALVALLLAALQGCCSPSSAEGAAKARALSGAELAALYAQMERYNGTEIRWDASVSPLPPEFSRAGALYGDVGRLDRLVFGGCMDDKAALLFDGLDGVGERQIRLLPGERQSAEVLWRASNDSSRSE